MPFKIVLASASQIRGSILRNAGLQVEIAPARIDEEGIRAALVAEGATPRAVADALAEMKASRISRRHPEALVLGCDQVLDFSGEILSKPMDPSTARTQLGALRGRTHRLLSAAVVFRDGVPLWRHVGVARLTMRDISDAYLDDYLERNWESLRHSVGGYRIEEEGVRLFARIEGDWFTILGLPLIELLTWLGIRGDIAT